MEKEPLREKGAAEWEKEQQKPRFYRSNLIELKSSKNRMYPYSFSLDELCAAPILHTQFIYSYEQAQAFVSLCQVYGVLEAHWKVSATGRGAGQLCGGLNVYLLYKCDKADKNNRQIKCLE